jgi:hypothetical protein
VIGGKTLGAFVGGIMTFLLSVGLQRKYNWYGQKGKKAFGALKISGVVCSKCHFYILSTVHATQFREYTNCIAGELLR